MNVDLLRIGLKYKTSLYFDKENVSNKKAVFNKEMIAFSTIIADLGYVLSPKLYEYISTMSSKKRNVLLENVISILEDFKGARSYKTLYPNFPKEVQEMSNFELYINAIIHYVSGGLAYPDSEKLERPKEIDLLKFQQISIIDDDGMISILKCLLSSNDSLSTTDKDAIEILLSNFGDKIRWDFDIPYKETLCYVVDYTKNLKLLKTSTDVLRYCTYLSGGDVSLSTNTRFKSLPRKTRKEISERLFEICKDFSDVSDLKSHKNKWIKLSHSLHVGDFVKKEENNNFFKVISDFRNNVNIYTMSSHINETLKAKQPARAIHLLSKRPGEFTRNIFNLVSMFENYETSKKILEEEYYPILDKISTRVLLQLSGHIKYYLSGHDDRLIMPKGSTKLVRKVEFKKYKEWQKQILDEIRIYVSLHLKERFKDLSTDEFKKSKVYIDNRLKHYTLPAAQRSASDGHKSFGRGTKIDLFEDDADLTKKSTLRMFVHWIGRDIDLSATFYDKEFRVVNTCSFQNLKTDVLDVYHSGDITNAPRGASEFIDINLKESKAVGIRYVSLNVNVYKGPTFKEHEECFAGFMLREKPNSNEIYDVKTVKYSLRLTDTSKVAVPFLFDLKKKKIIWADLYFKTSIFEPNTILNNMVSVTDILSSVTKLTDKITLKDLFSLWSDPKNIVDDPEDANILYVTDDYQEIEGDDKTIVKASDIIKINSEFLN